MNVGITLRPPLTIARGRGGELQRRQGDAVAVGAGDRLDLAPALRHLRRRDGPASVFIASSSCMWRRKSWKRCGPACNASIAAPTLEECRKISATESGRRSGCRSLMVKRPAVSSLRTSMIVSGVTSAWSMAMATVSVLNTEPSSNVLPAILSSCASWSRFGLAGIDGGQRGRRQHLARRHVEHDAGSALRLDSGRPRRRARLRPRAARRCRATGARAAARPASRPARIRRRPPRRRSARCRRRPCCRC